MTYSVVWLPAAEHELTAIWLDSRFRDAVTRASAMLERRLQHRAPNVVNPGPTVGGSISSGRSAFFTEWTKPERR